MHILNNNKIYSEKPVEKKKNAFPDKVIFATKI